MFKICPKYPKCKELRALGFMNTCKTEPGEGPKAPQQVLMLRGFRA